MQRKLKLIIIGTGLGLMLAVAGTYASLHWSAYQAKRLVLAKVSDAGKDDFVELVENSENGMFCGVIRTKGEYEITEGIGGFVIDANNKVWFAPKLVSAAKSQLEADALERQHDQVAPLYKRCQEGGHRLIFKPLPGMVAPAANYSRHNLSSSL